MADNTPDLELTRGLESGAISSITVPATWKQEEGSYLTRGTVTRFEPPQPGVPAIAILATGVPVAGDANRAFRALLAANQGMQIPKPLSAREITELSDVIGFSTVGDNQYSNKYRPPDPKAPAFNLASALLVNVAGRTVLEVKGNFVDQSGQAGTHYRGIFAPEGKDHVIEVLMEAPSRDEIETGSSNFRRAVDSIQWR